MPRVLRELEGGSVCLFSISATEFHSCGSSMCRLPVRLAGAWPRARCPRAGGCSAPGGPAGNTPATGGPTRWWRAPRPHCGARPMASVLWRKPSIPFHSMGGIAQEKKMGCNLLVLMGRKAKTILWIHNLLCEQWNPWRDVLIGIVTPTWRSGSQKCPL